MRTLLATSALLWAGLLLEAVVASAQERSKTAEPEQILGKRSPIAIESQPPETAPVAAGSRLHAEPGRQAPILATVRADTELEVLRREGDWLEVRYESWRGWVLTGQGGEQQGMLSRPGWVIESGDGGGPRFLEAPPRSPRLTAARLERMRELLGPREREREFGPYTLYTDVADDALIAALEAAAENLEATYRNRFGLELADAPLRAVVLFASEEDYRAYEMETPEISGLATLGHQSHGVAVTFVASRGEAQIRRILLHELTHLLNRRALPPELPSWLEEGLAEELSLSEVDGLGRILPGTLLGQDSAEQNGPASAVASLGALLRHHEQPTWPGLSSLVGTSWEDFVQPESRPVYYTQAALFIRFLIDGREGILADAFRSYLRRIGRLDVEGAGLWKTLGEPKAEIEAAYDAWILDQGRIHGLVTKRP